MLTNVLPANATDTGVDVAAGAAATALAEPATARIETSHEILMAVRALVE